jgi:acyl-coenzyme A synthetase/AMP-(fatty) acid ligase
VLLSPGSLPRTSSGKLRRLEVKRNLGLVLA